MIKILSLTAACALFAAPAFAEKMAQTHHCDMSGTEVAKTHKECTKAGGKWAKGAPMATIPAAAANPGGVPPSAPVAGKQSPPPPNPDPSRDPAKNPKIPVNTSPTPNGNNPISPPPGDRTPGN